MKSKTKSPFSRLVRELMGNVTQKTALTALQEASEAFLERVLKGMFRARGTMVNINTYL